MRRRLLVALAWFGVVCAAGSAVAVVTGSAHAESAPCRNARALAVPEGERDPKVELPIVKKANENDRLLIEFGDSRDPDHARVPLTVFDWDKSMESRYGLEFTLGQGYLTRAGTNEISATEPGLLGGMVPLQENLFELCLSVLPKQLTGLGLGSYSSSLVVDAAPGAELLVSVPVELTFRASRWFALWVAILGYLLGVSAKVLSEAAAAQRAGQLGPWQALREYCKQLDFPLALLLGGVASAFVFRQVYVENPSWGATSDDILTLFGLCFVAQLSSNEAVSLVRRAVTVPPTHGA